MNCPWRLAVRRISYVRARKRAPTTAAPAKQSESLRDCDRSTSPESNTSTANAHLPKSSVVHGMSRQHVHSTNGSHRSKLSTTKLGHETAKLQSKSNQNQNQKFTSRNTNTRVLDLYFQDTAIHNGRVVDYFSQSVPYVTPQTPVAASYKQVKGPYSLFMEHMYSKGLVRHTPYLYRCDYFSVFYYPPWHFLALGRKSRPGIMTVFGPGAQNNDVYDAQTESKKLQVLAKHGLKSRNPVAFAYWRTFMSRCNRKYLLQSWNNAFETSGSAPPDGLFVVRCDRVLRSGPQLRAHFDTVVKRAQAMLSNKNSLAWVAKANSQVDLAGFNRFLLSRGMGPIAWIPREKWRI